MKLPHLPHNGLETFLSQMIPNVKVTAEECLEFIGDDSSEDCSFDAYFGGLLLLLLLFDHDVFCVLAVAGGGGGEG
jgi:hypothetical protein